LKGIRHRSGIEGWGGEGRENLSTRKFGQTSKKSGIGRSLPAWKKKKVLIKFEERTGKKISETLFNFS